MVILIGEWQLFRYHKERMIALKQEYQLYLTELQRNYGFQEEDDEDDPTPFNVVNREFNYLKDSALTFARDHNLADAVQAIYGPMPHSSLYLHTVLNPQKAGYSIKKNHNLLHSSSPSAKKIIDFFVEWPLHSDAFWLSSCYGPRRKRDGAWGFHHGIDMAALKGTPVYAAAAGMVTEAAYSPRGYGKYIKIKHNKKYETRYAHLDTLGVKAGQHVRQGTLIGRVGATGLVRGKNASHLHFEVLLFGKHINPLYILS